MNILHVCVCVLKKIIFETSSNRKWILHSSDDDIFDVPYWKNISRRRVVLKMASLFTFKCTHRKWCEIEYQSWESETAMAAAAVYANKGRLLMLFKYDDDNAMSYI